jgi:hypothetical protein
MDDNLNNDGGGEHWSQGFEHASVTPENREAFNTSMAKYESQNDAVVGGYNAQKSIGSPFVLPESMESLPDDASRSKLTTEARTLLNINIPKTVDDLKDFDFKNESGEMDEGLVGMVKDFAVAEGIDSASLQKMLKFYNGPMTKYGMEQMANNDTAAFEADGKACNEALIADPEFGSLAKVEEQSELFKRSINAMATKNGLDAEATAEVVQAFVDGGLSKNPNAAKIMLQAFAPMSAEGGTLSGDGNGGSGKDGQLTPYQWKQREFPASQSEWGSPNDTWEEQSRQLRNQAKIKL